MTLALVFVECEDGHSSAVKNLTEKIDGVREAHSISGGDYDIVVKVNARDHELHAALAAIRQIGGISALSTSIVCKSLT
jgi:DNA-binding Lrp family transcriptional regulator